MNTNQIFDAIQTPGMKSSVERQFLEWVTERRSHDVLLLLALERGARVTGCMNPSKTQSTVQYELRIEW